MAAKVSSQSSFLKESEGLLLKSRSLWIIEEGVVTVEVD